MKAYALVASLLAGSACADGRTTVLIERQGGSLAAARADGWVAGSAVVIGQVGSLTFPQPVAIRISLIDPDAPVDAETPPEPKLVSTAKATVFGEGVGVISQNVTCQPTYCDAEVTMSDFGLAMLQIVATGKDGKESSCFYYGVYEEADPAAAGDAHRDAAEAAQVECRRDLYD